MTQSTDTPIPMPERVWVEEFETPPNQRVIISSMAWPKQHPGITGTEYVRADLVPQWQPIKTAPRDGTDVLLWWPHWYGIPMPGWFDHSYWSTHGELDDPNGPGPTHWMPLPAPPVSHD